MEWLSLVLGGGAVATIGAVFQGIKMLRESTSARTAKAVGDLERWRVEADERTRASREDSEWYADLADYWRSWAGQLEYEASKSGVAIPTRPPLPVRDSHPLPRRLPEADPT